ncbi:hypothetical protein ACHAP5_002462 [Fusarium lateritium]
MSLTSLNQTDINEQLADLSAGLSSPYNAMENLHAQAQDATDQLSTYSTPEQLQAITQGWDEFCGWWQKPHNLIVLACLSLMPVILLVVYALLRGKVWGWGCLRPLGFGKGKEESQHSIYTTRPSQRAEDWRRAYPPQSRIRRMEARRADSPPRKGSPLGDQDIALTSLDSPYNSTCNTYSRRWEDNYDGISQDNIWTPASTFEQGSSGHAPHTPPTQPQGQTSRPHDRDSTAQGPSSHSSQEAPPPPYENVDLDDK